MNILALETAVDPGTVALLCDGRCIVRRCLDGQSNSSAILPLLTDVLREARLDLNDIDRIAFGKGPGAFTGVRIACGITQGLSVARETPLFAVGTLDAMAWSSHAPQVIVLLDARMGEVYAGFFDNGQPCGEIAVHAPENIPIPSRGEWVVCGNGAALPGVRERLSPRAAAWMPDVLPNAEGVAHLAAALPDAARIDPALAAPLYVRNHVAKTLAERQLELDKSTTPPTP